MTGRITLRLEGGQWTAQFHGEDAARVRGLFGAEKLPTSFTAAADPETVSTVVAERNPGYIIERIG